MKKQPSVTAIFLSMLVFLSGCFDPALNQVTQQNEESPPPSKVPTSCPPGFVMKPWTGGVDCVSWFDGCNSCSGIFPDVICTMRACLTETYREAECFRRLDGTPVWERSIGE